MTRAPMMTCRELVELVTDYLEERLPPEERTQFEAHLAVCDGCRTYVEQMRDTIRGVGALADERLSAGVRDELLRAFAAWRTGR